MTFIRPIFRIQQKVIFADLSFVTPSARNCRGMILITPCSKIWDFLRICGANFQILRFLQKVIFADLTFITPSYPEKEAGLTFITPSTRKLWL